MLLAALPLMAMEITPAQTAAGTASVKAREQERASAGWAAARYGELPLNFEANEGQADAGVRFVTRGSGYSVTLTDKAALLTLTRPAKKSATSGANGGGKTSVIGMEFAAKRAKPEVAGAERLAGTANYLMGNDPAKWHRGVATFGKVRYTGVYPGVDLVYYGNHRQLEYDFVVAPHARASEIRLRFSGVRELRLSPAGNLRLGADGGETVFKKPVLYQYKDGVRRTVSGSFILLAGRTAGFSVGEYDHERPLVIDPVLLYSTYLGSDAQVEAITTDAAGNAYVAGTTSATNFPITAGAFQTMSYAADPRNYATAFVTKLNPAGSGVVYSTYLGGTNQVYQRATDARAIAVNAAGEATVAGSTGNVDFPVTQGAYQGVNRANGGSNVFVTKLNAAGSALVYSTLLGGSGNLGGDEAAYGVALDAAGNAYVTGTIGSTDFPVTDGALQTTAADAGSFVTKLNPTGSGLVYSTLMNGAYLSSLALDAEGFAYVAGISTGNNFRTTPGAFLTTLPAATAGVVAKLNQAGSGLVYATFLGGSGTTFDVGGGTLVGIGDLAQAIAVDAQGNAFVAGRTSSMDFPVTTNAFQKTNTSMVEFNDTGFVTKLSANGDGLIYSTYMGGTSGAMFTGAQPASIQVDRAGSATVFGNTGFLDFPVTRGALQTANLNIGLFGELTPFLTRLNAAGSALDYSTYLGGFGGGNAGALTLDTQSNAYVVGGTGPGTYPVTGGAYQGTSSSYTGFVSKLSMGQTVTALAEPTSTGLTITGGLTDSEGLPTGKFLADARVTLNARVPALGSAGDQTGSVLFFYTDSSGNRGSLGSVKLVSGTATLVTRFALGGTYTLYAAYSGDSVYAGSLTNQQIVVSAVPARMYLVSGTHQTAVINTLFAEPLVVKVVDRFNNPVPGVVVFFSDSHCTFTSTESPTGADGTALTYVFAGPHAGAAGYTPTAHTAGLGVRFSLVNTKAPATVSLYLLDRVYTGYPLGVFATTVPAGLHVDFNYDGQGGKAPITVGTHTVVGTIGDRDYEGSVTATTIVEPRP